MKRFISKILFFTIPFVIFVVLFVYNAGGYYDHFYVRFTTPKHKNMILGTSRAAQGLEPYVFKNILNKNIGNYAFTVAHSPFGKVYYESIMRKHKKEKNGLFIIAIDPWSISSWSSSPNNLNEFRENKLCLSKIKDVDSSPNFSYIFQNFAGKYSGLFLRKTKTYLHKDGWLEVKNIAMDSISVANRISKKIKDYRNNYLPKAKYSSARFDYLIKIIEYLNDYGQVYLVRLPIHKSMMEIEDELMPDFDLKIKKAIELSDGYLDMTSKNEKFAYTDGNHLYKTSGEEVSGIVARWVKTQR